MDAAKRVTSALLLVAEGVVREVRVEGLDGILVR